MKIYKHFGSQVNVTLMDGESGDLWGELAELGVALNKTPWDEVEQYIYNTCHLRVSLHDY